MIEDARYDTEFPLGRGQKFLLCKKLEKDQPASPNVNLLRVNFLAKEHLWGLVKRSAYIWRHLFQAWPDVTLIGAAGQPKVYNFDNPMPIEHDVGRLEVSMDHFVRVKVVQARQQLLENALDVGLLKRDLGLANGVELMLRKLENHELRVLVRQAGIVRLVAHFHEFDDVWVRGQLFEQVPLPDEILTRSCAEFPDDHGVVLLVDLPVSLGDARLKLRKTLFVALQYRCGLDFVEKLFRRIYLVVLSRLNFEHLAKTAFAKGLEDVVFFVEVKLFDLLQGLGQWPILSHG